MTIITAIWSVAMAAILALMFWVDHIRQKYNQSLIDSNASQKNLIEAQYNVITAYEKLLAAKDEHILILSNIIQNQDERLKLTQQVSEYSNLNIQ